MRVSLRCGAGAPALLLTCALAFAACTRTAESGTARAELTVVTPAGERHVFQAEVAVSSSERRRGLMFREYLPVNHGMLFLYQPAQRVSIWMKNTLLPLDIIFIDTQGRITRIEHNAVPLSTRPMSSGVAVRAVLEINGGMAESLRLAPGDRVIYTPLWAERAP